jgi:glycosyltransferase involved in cell wall biosynthesis
MTTPRVAFVNGGILGLLSYVTWLRRTFTDDREIHAEHFVLTENLTIRERIVRRVLSQRLWPDRRGWHNVDYARFRRELNAGLQARWRLLARGLEHFDVLHFHRQATAYASLDLMARVPSIVSIDCTQSCMLQDATTARERRSLHPNVARDGWIFDRARAIVSTSQWTKSEIERMYPRCATPIHVMPNPVGLDVFDAVWIEERRAHPSPRVRFLFIGGDFPRKGGPQLLDAWVEGNFARRAELTVVTDWKLRAPLPPGVRLVSGVQSLSPAWVDAWRRADVFVMPTLNEAFGLVYQEAAAAGLPAIGSRLNAIPEIIEDGVTGILTQPGNRPALIAAMDTLMASADLRATMGKAARRKIEIDADPETHRRRLLALIKQAMQRP